jgi:SulP family sulfate permease
VFSEGYRFADLRADIVAGLTVAVVALPLSMAIAVACGTTPERGLFAAIVGGFFISAFGGSRFQIGGPAGAFIVLIAAAVARHGIEGVILATALSGCFLLVAGLFRLGSLIRLIPPAVTVGFTAGIAVIIFVSQIKDSLGLHLAGPEPGEIVSKIEALARAGATITPAAIAICLATVGIIVGVRRYYPRWPGMLVAIVITAFMAWALGLPVETIGSRFGQLPSTLPLPAFPDMSVAKIRAILPDALAFTLLGAIESLL